MSGDAGYALLSGAAAGGALRNAGYGVGRVMMIDELVEFDRPIGKSKSL